MIIVSETIIENTVIKYSIDEKGNYIIGGQKPTKEQKKCHDKDCESKKLILNKIMNNPLTSTQLWTLIRGEYDGKYKTYTSLLVRYQRYGYITKHGKKPFIYKLTEWGVENAKNPYMARDEQKRRYKQFQIDTVGQFINENPSYIKQFADDSGYIGGSDGVRVIESNDFVDNHANDDKINELEAKVKELEEELKEEREITENLYNQNKPTMVINQAPQQPQQPQQEPETKKTDERSFDNILWEYKDRMMDYSAYRKLPKQILKVIAFPKGDISENIRNLLQGKKKGGLITVPSNTVSTLTNYGFVETLRKEEIELLMMRFINGKVVLISPNGAGFEITDVPQSARPPQPQNKPVAKPRVSIKVK